LDSTKRGWLVGMDVCYQLDFLPENQYTEFMKIIPVKELKTYFTGEDQDFKELLQNLQHPKSEIIFLSPRALEYLQEFHDLDFSYDFWKSFGTGPICLNDILKSQAYQDFKDHTIFSKKFHEYTFGEEIPITNALFIDNLRDFLDTIPEMPNTVYMYISGEIDLLEKQYLRADTFTEIIH